MTEQGKGSERDDSENFGVEPATSHRRDGKLPARTDAASSGPPARRDRREPPATIEDSCNLIEGVLEALPEEQRGSIVALIQDMTWTCRIPPPEIFNQYDESTRETLLKQANWDTVDESKRQDKLVEAEVMNGCISQSIILLVVLASSCVAAYMAIARSDAIMAGVFFSPLLLILLRLMINRTRSNSSRDEGKQQHNSEPK